MAKITRNSASVSSQPNGARTGVSRRRWLVGAGAVAVGGAGVYLAANMRTGAREYTYQIVHRYPHRTDAFTQGLVYHGDNVLYEGTGDYDNSRLRKVDLRTGEVLREIPLPDPGYFGEGITLWQDTIFQITWQDNVAFVYHRDSFEQLREFRYDGEGWGLTHDGESLIMSDGTDRLAFRDPATFQITREVHVRDAGRPVTRLNELEYIDGEIYANIWETDSIARIAPDTGQVVARIDLTGLRPASTRNHNEKVLNGIAFDANGRRLFVTGKLWPELYEIRLVPK